MSEGEVWDTAAHYRLLHRKKEEEIKERKERAAQRLVVRGYSMGTCRSMRSVEEEVTSKSGATCRE